MRQMRRFLIAPACLAASLAHAQALAPDQLFDRISPSVWIVVTHDAQGKAIGLGSGVVIAAKTLITNCHVLKGARTAAVRWGAKTLPARLEHADPERDLCQFQVTELDAPAVEVAAANRLRVGSRVYAIGNPRGLELTISDGLLSGLRRTDAGELEAVQTTAPISPGSSGGGLFDAEGRLVGITTWALRDAQNLNFAIPANWIAEVPARARAREARRNAAPSASGTAALVPPAARAAAPPAAPAARASTPVEVAAVTRPVTGPELPALGNRGLGTPPTPGQVYEYRLTERTTRLVQKVEYRVESIADDRIVFSGARVESGAGKVLDVGVAAGGEADRSMPPGGWFLAGTSVGSSWNLDYQTAAPARNLSLRARASGHREFQIDGRTIRALQIDFSGFIDRNPAIPGSATGPYRATAWYSPELSRLIRFEVFARGGVSGGQFIVDEVLELVAVR